MKGIFARISESFSWANDKIQHVLYDAKNKLSEFSSLTNVVLSSPTVRKESYNFFVRFWSGYSMPWHTAVLPAFVGASKSRAAIGSSFWHNMVIYAGTAFVYEYSKNLLNQYHPEAQDSYAEMAVDVFAYSYLINQGIVRTFDNLFGFNGAVASAAYEENVDKAVTKACSHNKANQVQGLLMEPVLYISDILALQILNLLLKGMLPPVVLPFAKFLTVVPFKALVMGKSMTEYKFGEDKCTEHRERLFSQNKAHLFGFGLSLAVSVEFWNYVIYHYTGVQSAFIDDALTNFIGQLNIFISYTRDQPLPVDERQFKRNLLKWNHDIATSVVKDVGEMVIPRLANPKLRGPLIRMLKNIYSWPFSGWVMRIVLPKKLQSVETIVQLPGINLHLKYKRAKIENLMQGFQDFRNSYGASILIYLPTMIVGENIQNILKCAMRKEWDDVFNFVNYVLRCAEVNPARASLLVPSAAFQRALTYAEDAISYDEVLRVESQTDELNAENLPVLSKQAESPAASSLPYPSVEDLDDMVVVEKDPKEEEEFKVIDNYIPADAIMPETVETMLPATIPLLPIPRSPSSNLLRNSLFQAIQVVSEADAEFKFVGESELLKRFK